MDISNSDVNNSENMQLARVTPAIKCKLFNLSVRRVLTLPLPRSIYISINMKNMEESIEYEIISVYKKVIWHQVIEIRFNRQVFDRGKMVRDFDRDLGFYLEYLYK